MLRTEGTADWAQGAAPPDGRGGHRGGRGPAPGGGVPRRGARWRPRGDHADPAGDAGRYALLALCLEKKTTVGPVVGQGIVSAPFPPPL